MNFVFITSFTPHFFKKRGCYQGHNHWFHICTLTFGYNCEWVPTLAHDVGLYHRFGGICLFEPSINLLKHEPLAPHFARLAILSNISTSCDNPFDKNLQRAEQFVHDVRIDLHVKATIHNALRFPDTSCRYANIWALQRKWIDTVLKSMRSTYCALPRVITVFLLLANALLLPNTDYMHIWCEYYSWLHP